MDIKKLKKLIELVETSNISALCLEEDNTKIEIKKESTTQVIQTAVQPTVQAAPAVPAPVAAEASAEASSPAQDPNLTPIPSPMVGTFYSSPNPESPVFVSEGSTIKSGDVVCIVEAMKLFNEIESEISGTIETICVKNGDPVEFGQPLFMVRT